MVIDNSKSALISLNKIDNSLPVFIMSVAAGLVGMHPNTLRKYERAGLVSPSRSKRLRKYSINDIRRLLELKELADKGVNIAGLKIILENRLKIMKER